jgi:phosphoserine phosphatase
MLYVATLISHPANPALSDALVDGARQALSPLASSPTVTGAVAWLNPGIAADLSVEGPEAPAFADGIENALRAAIGSAPVDVVVQPAATRRKRLFLADMDSTMIGQECIDELADFAGLKDKVSLITERAMRGEIAFEPALRERVALLRGLPVSIVDEIIASRITLTPGGRPLVATMRAKGAHCALVSGGFTLFTGPIGRMIGFDEDRSNRLLVADGKLLGLVEEPILGRQAKLDTLVERRTRFGLAIHETLAVGDGANDLAMLGAAGLGVAFRAKPAVAAAAHARIDHADLTALLYMQGYAISEFVPG